MPRTDRSGAARPFTGMALDRASELRKDPARVEQLLHDPASRVVLVGPDGVRVADGRLERLPLTPKWRKDAILLGLEDGHGVFAAKADDQAELMPVREVGTELPREEAGLAAYAVALLGWHRRHRFCANCGAPTEIAEAGYSRHCPRCGATHFPRTDPVVIMTVEHDRCLLLGRRAAWPAGRVSVLAGFVSPGESAEEAVVREVREESGIIARDPEFLSSQPWPFPSSLMLGFAACSDGGEPSPRDGELAEVRWVPLEDIREAIEESHPQIKLPPPVSIARYLIDCWVARHAD